MPQHWSRLNFCKCVIPKKQPLKKRIITALIIFKEPVNSINFNLCDKRKIHKFFPCPCSPREQVRSQRQAVSRGKVSPGWTPRRRCSKGKRPLTSFDLAASKVSKQFPRQPPISKYTARRGTLTNSRMVFLNTSKQTCLYITCHFCGRGVFHPEIDLQPTLPLFTHADPARFNVAFIRRH
ncbi:hypothetical protein NPIL_315321 [Nephila pilipes]|uniref:Uncharacterized protein n=1 Tax=Nephila pilipes TaxID=299642 RepID=A0A8X6PAT1_NEPPI|nr:hypothetical protein NPIL_315321 [Nephila pilipes]